jgi:tetratricopeptide (TPR) repeat protein
MARTLLRAGRHEKAISVLNEAITMFRKIGDRHGEGTAISDLGTAVSATGRYDEAITLLNDAIALLQETGDEHAVAIARNSLEGTAAAVRK